MQKFDSQVDDLANKINVAVKDFKFNVSIAHFMKLINYLALLLTLV